MPNEVPRILAPIEDAIVRALGDALAAVWDTGGAETFDRIEPDAIEVPDDPDAAALPAAAWRQLGADRETFINAPAGGVQTWTGLIELFDRPRDALSRGRDWLLRTFAGPVPADPRAGPLDPDAPYEPVKWGDVWVFSAEMSDPTGDVDLGATDAHIEFRFVQLIFTVQFAEG